VVQAVMVGMAVVLETVERRVGAVVMA
jgi:hypothetical protein